MIACTASSPPAPATADTKVLLYFSASWCPPCRQFTPNLVKYYNHVNKDSKKVEIIMLACEIDPTSAQTYATKYAMPWTMVDPSSPTHADAVKSIYGIWAGPRDGDVLGTSAHAGIPQILEIDPSTGQPLKNYRTLVNDYVREHNL